MGCGAQVLVGRSTVVGGGVGACVGSIWWEWDSVVVVYPYEDVAGVALGRVEVGVQC